MSSILQAISGLDDYDPQSLHLAQARALICQLVEPLAGSQRMFVGDALGRVLAEDVISPIDVPAHDNSAMDGYALRFADLDPAAVTRLSVAGTAYAGHPFGGELGRGQCLRIMTGAVMPPQADTVVMQEVVECDGDHVLIPPAQRRGQHWRRAGEDLKSGRPALTDGRRIRPAELGLLASLGIAEISVRPRLRVAIFSTGDELCSIGRTPRAGEVFDSNRYTLYGMLERLGCEVLDLGVVPDQPAALENALMGAAASADAVITSGGVSVGEADFIREMMNRLGEVLFWKIAMKPGRPMAFGRLGSGRDGAILFGLPGNPVAVMVTFYQLVREALLRMMGVDPLPVLPLLLAPCSVALRKAPGRTEFQRGTLTLRDGRWQVRPNGAQGSGMLRSMADADCFIVIEHERGDVNAGELVQVQLMEGLI